ncbi:hypothetical protein [Phenylobacterium sp.]|uniref:phage adaptor protein n=1 Tax=Phenylobacterium sp. TaxID=1871053 RepID=UPI00272EFD2D|nr:hypothetical protein [Phenylobacterium sp.]MDP1616782.1 hypothetical protein [Phenylobacterium sp.]MDP1988272.1 hypothetical protein [Phenylobacterium sp.]
MALTTYDDLKAATADWLERSDLAGRASDFITLAEARLNRELRLAVMESEVDLAAPPGARTLDLPADCREALGLWRADGPARTPMRYRPAGLMPRSDQGGRPDYWSLEGGKILLERPCDGETSFVLRQVGRLALSAEAPTNAVLAEHPDLYLFATLAEACPYLRDGEMAGHFNARFEMALAQARAADARRHGMASLVTDLPRREAVSC